MSSVSDIPARNMAPGRIRMGAFLTRVRLGSCLKQIEVAERLGISQTTLSKLERGRAVLTVEYLQKFAVVYRMNDRQLLWFIRGIQDG